MTIQLMLPIVYHRLAHNQNIRKHRSSYRRGRFASSDGGRNLADTAISVDIVPPPRSADRGNAKVLLLKSYAIAEDGSAIWELKLSQAAPYKRKTEAPVPGVADDNGYDGPDVSNEGPQPNFDDVEIPF